MKPIKLAIAALFLLPSHLTADFVKAKDGSGVIGYKDTPKLPWCDYVMHDPDRPLPPKVQVGPAAASVPPPSDAVVLFDGKDLSAWQASNWKVEDGHIVAGDGKLTSKQSFGDVQVHVEWMAPTDFKGPWYGAGNNGVTLMDQFEIQIFDSADPEIKLYADGECGAIYGQTPPLVNVCRKAGEWQSFDIFFAAPVFENGKLVKPARVTALQNGVLIHLNQEIYGETRHRIFPAYHKTDSVGPISLPSHYCPVRLRNIWARPIKAPQSIAAAESMTDIDGNVYSTVKIGDQIWTCENLKTTRFNDGTPIPQVKDPGEWKELNSAAFCYYENNHEHGKTYGLLYNWHAANSDKIAPKGWRVPTIEEQLALRDYLITHGYNYDGTTEGNKIAKAMATTSEWPYLEKDAYGNAAPDLAGMIGNKPETNNQSGFSARPSGCRWSDGSFHAGQTSVYWWSTTPHEDSHARHTSVHTWFAKFGDNHHHQRTGFSIRLIRDDRTR